MDNIPTISDQMSIRETMTVIDKHAKRICFVLDDKKVLVGVVSDGDIRRALLNGRKLDDQTHSVMNKDFVSFPMGTDSKVIRERFSQRIRQIPLVDENGCLCDVADPRGNFRISVLEPSMMGNENKYVSECINTNWISSQGKFVNEFEKVFEAFHSETFALSVSNGTIALHLALIALGIGDGDEVIVPDLTFAASANAVIHSGATPVFSEVDPQTWCIDPHEAEKLISPRTKAIMPVHLYGHPCNMDLLKALCEKYELLMIEDAAEALGSEWMGKKVGTFGDAATFSFFGNKTISTGEGGMILFKDPKIAEKAKVLRDHGMSKDKRYWHEVIGYNYRLTNIQAAIGVAQMEKFQDILNNKIKISSSYDSYFKEVEGIMKLPNKLQYSLHSNWLYGVVLEDEIDRDVVCNELLALGIETRPFFYPLHSMPPYGQFKRSQSLSTSISISKNGLSLPSSTNLSENELISISQSVIQILQDQIKNA
jgi:perosamine synthetase